MFKEAFYWLEEIIFPVYCVTCAKEGSWWCNRCRPTPQPFSIDQFFAVTPLLSVTALFNLHDPGVQELVHNFKYRYATSVKKVWQDCLPPTAPCASDTVIIPVPLFARRERERGFNQAKIIAELLAAFYQLPLNHSLVRSRATQQQAKLNREERHQNVADAFTWQGSSLPPKKILLVDDVFTTGATMRECAQVLLASGAKEVSGFTLAHG